MSTESSFDLIVLGAGPTGSAAAVTGRKQGLSVAVIDKARFPRDKLCGGLVTGRSMQYFREIFGQDLDPTLIETRTRITFHLDGQEMGEMDDVPPMHLTMRYGFDDHLLTLAIAAGATPFLGQRVQSFDFAAKRLDLQNGVTLSFKALIGADGVNSIVARELFGRSHDPETIGFALEKEMPAEAAPGPVRIDFGAADYGYGWSFPKARSTTFGVAGIHRLNRDMKDRFHAYAASCGQIETDRVKGHFLPFGDYLRQPGRGAVLLAGDAAGLVDPITGEGIAYAMKSGQLAAHSAAAAIADGTSDTAMTHYQRAIRPIHRSLRLAKLLRPAIFGKRSGRAFAKSFSAGGGTLKQAYLRMLAGEAEYQDLIGLAVRKTPKLIWYSLKRSPQQKL